MGKKIAIIIFLCNILPSICNSAYTRLYGQNDLLLNWKELFSRLTTSSDTITITIVGDIMQHGPQIQSAFEIGEKKNYDYTGCFKYVDSLFKTSDYSIANMEFTVGTKPYSGYPQFSAPEQIADQVKESGIDLFLLANNHIADKGKNGLKKTLDYYKSIDIAHIGAYYSKEEEAAKNPIIVEIKGVKFALINFTYGTNGIPVPSPFFVCKQDTIHLKEVIKRAKDSYADFIIALPHWGEEYHLSPSATQKSIAKFLFANGVNAIVGSHPHVPQEAYIEDDKIVFYSLGNFISNQSNPPYTQVGMIAQLRFTIDKLSKKKKMITPKWLYTWCFRKREMDKGYTVVPIEIFRNSNEYKEKESLKKFENSFKLMNKTYNFIQNKKLVNGREENSIISN